MLKEPPRILAVNPGSRYIGYAVFRGPEILDWGVKIVVGKTLSEKQMSVQRTMADLIEQYCPNVLAVKKLHLSRSSSNLNELVRQIENLAGQHQIKLCRYSIQELETMLCPKDKINKRTLASIVANMYPTLLYELQKESRSQNPYRIRMFEAVALAAVCWQKYENK